LLLGSGFQWQMFPFLWVPEFFPASATSFSQQQQTIIEPQQSSGWLTLQQLIDSTYNFGTNSL
jgi:hypothetical protein